MRIAGQFGMILMLSFVGEWLNKVLPFPVPASVCGFCVLFVLLLLKVIRLEQIKDVADFFVEIMPMLFVPAGVGLMASWGMLKSFLWQTAVVIVVSTIVVMVVSGRVTQWVIQRKKKGHGWNELQKNRKVRNRQ